jgi:hypothetical protein
MADTDIYELVRSDDGRAVQNLLLEDKIRVDYHQKGQDLPLFHYAVLKKANSVLSILIRQIRNDQADCTIINKPVREGIYKEYTPLHFASATCNFYAIQMLLALGANIKLTTKDGVTPLLAIAELTIANEFDPQESIDVLVRKEKIPKSHKIFNQKKIKL